MFHKLLVDVVVALVWKLVEAIKGYFKMKEAEKAIKKQAKQKIKEIKKDEKNNVERAKRMYDYLSS